MLLGTATMLTGAYPRRYEPDDLNRRVRNRFAPHDATRDRQAWRSRLEACRSAAAFSFAAVEC
jgi:hypothetical protein